MDEMKTVSQIMERMREHHFIHDFSVSEDKLVCKSTGESFTPDEVIVEKVYRFEGDSDPEDMAIVYGIESKSGTKGILLDAYGTYADPEVSEFIKNVPLDKENDAQEHSDKADEIKKL
ncbi:hypothetical protein BH10BAC5_BH10BAC5_05030 [soil metagenome]